MYIVMESDYGMAVMQGKNVASGVIHDKQCNNISGLNNWKSN